MNEQIFISYRREGGDITAKLICESLKNNGYTVFYDFDSISGGYFDQRIFEAIKGCKDFILVLPKNSLDRCVNPDDWVRQEIAFALAHKKNVIPVMLPDFSFPKELPKDIENIARINAVQFVMAYFDSMMDTIMDRLISKPLYAGGAAPIAASPLANTDTRTKNTSDRPASKSKPAATAHGKKGGFIKPLIVIAIALILIGLLGAFVVWPMLIYPNMASDDLYTPEIVQTYSGAYSASGMSGEAIITIASCDQAGKITGTFEFIDSGSGSEKIYGKYEISGSITQKKNNGNVTLTVIPGQWIIQPEGYTPFESMEVSIYGNYQSLECPAYSMLWSLGESDEYAVKTADDLKKLIGSDATYQLKNDIDLAGANHTPIEGFTGTLLGNGYTIKNLSISSSASDTGFFAVLEGKVQNLKLENVTVEVSGRNENVGILCGQLKGTINNVSVSGTVTAEKSANVGGVCGLVSTKGTYTLDMVSSSASVSGLSFVGGCFGKVDNYVSNGTDPYSLTLSNIKNSGTVTALEDYAGGIAAYVNANADGFTGCVITAIVDCENTGSVTGNYYVAGIVGKAECDSMSYIESCKNAASITAKAYAGCIAGMAHPYTISDCSNEGSALNATGYFLDGGERYAYVGGYVGYGICTENCTNYVDINYTGGGSFVGGLMGYCHLSAAANPDGLLSNVDVSLKNLQNQGNISGGSYVGGIMGGTMYLRNDAGAVVTATLENVVNTGSVTATGDFVGGISGYMAGEVIGMNSAMCWNVFESANQGAITGRANVGGLFGGFLNGEAGSNGWARNTVTIDGCSSTGTVVGESNTGEIIGLDEIVK